MFTAETRRSPRSRREENENRTPTGSCLALIGSIIPSQTSTLPVNALSVRNVLQEGGEEMKTGFQQIKVGALSLAFAALMCASTAIIKAQDLKPEMTRPEPSSPPASQPSSPPPAPPPSAPAPSTPSQP